MAALDWGLLAALLVSFVLGAWRGLVFELLSLAGWVVAFFVARAWGASLGELLPLGEAQAAWRPAAGFGLLFVATVFACGLLATLARKLMLVAGLRAADRALGALFGLVRGVALLLLATWLALHTPLAQQPWWQASRMAALLEDTVAQAGVAPAQDWLRHLSGPEH
ncbi:CvpA family protein [Comamonas flocculans]|uniref:CvpA family protein n=1 Tax=Comamonas flocculans TaxID=2597701 RepID=A0A5B8RQF0_9BURK|nr:CvpA family protein [Comamonas flocculans]QEA11766.1 CvpA family protein [Comamonas flocculans]